MMEGPNVFLVKSPVPAMNIYREEELRFKGPEERREFQQWLDEKNRQPTNLIANRVPGSFELTRNRNPRSFEIKRRCRHCGK